MSIGVILRVWIRGGLVDTLFLFRFVVIKLYMSPRVEMATVIIALSTIHNAEHF